MEVVGGCVFRMQMNHRKAFTAEERVTSSEIRNPFVAVRVLVAGYDIRSIILTQGSPSGRCPPGPGVLIRRRKSKEHKDR